MARLVFRVALLFALVHVSLPLHAQQTSVSLNVCNAGEVDIDVFLSQAGKVTSSRIGPADCAAVAKSAGSLGRTYVGLAFVDVRGRWGAARRQDLLPYWGGLPGSGGTILERANQNISVPHGNTSVSLPMQLLFQPPTPSCQSNRPYRPSAVASLPLNATRAQIAAARSMDINANAPPDSTMCDALSYKLNVLAYPDSREITFMRFCDSCDRKADARITPEERAAGQQRLNAANQMARAVDSAAGFSIMGSAMNAGNQELEEERKERRRELASPQRVNWHDMREYLSQALPANSSQEPINKKFIVQATVASVELPAPGASEPWVKVYFTEAPDRRFSIVTFGADIFQDVFGPDFSTRMIGKTLEIEGEATRAYCSGGCIRVSLARQVRLVGSGAGMVAAVAAPNITFPKPTLTPEGEVAKKRMDEATRQYELERQLKRQQEDALRRSLDQFSPRWIGQGLIIKGTVSRVQKGRGTLTQLFFQESPDGAFVACFAGDLFVGFANSGPDFQGLVGKSVELRGRVRAKDKTGCGGTVADLAMSVPTQITVLSASGVPTVASGGRAKGSATGTPQQLVQQIPQNSSQMAPAPSVAPSPSPEISSQAVPPVQPAPASPAPATAQMRDLTQRYQNLMTRSAQARAGLGQIEQRLARQRLGLRSDIVNARTRMDTQLRTAKESIGRGDAGRAEESLRYAEAALTTIERFLGR